MPSKDVTKEEWDEICELSADIADAICEEADFVTEKITHQLLYKLSRLRLKYGELPILLSTRADHIDDLDERLRLYKRAIELALEIGDDACATQSAESIAQIYIEELQDQENGQTWLNQLKEYVSRFGDKWIVGTMSELETGLNRLRIRAVKSPCSGSSEAECGGS